jgi:hypothetical protein
MHLCALASGQPCMLRPTILLLELDRCGSLRSDSSYPMPHPIPSGCVVGTDWIWRVGDSAKGCAAGARAGVNEGGSRAEMTADATANDWLFDGCIYVVLGWGA